MCWIFQEERSLKTNEMSQQESKNMEHTRMKVKAGSYSQEKRATETEQQLQRITSSGIYNEKQSSSSQSNITRISNKNIHTGAHAQVLFRLIFKSYIHVFPCFLFVCFPLCYIFIRLTFFFRTLSCFDFFFISYIYISYITISNSGQLLEFSKVITVE